MEYIIVKDGIIIDHLCGDKLPEGAVAVLDNAPIVVGTPLSHYKSGWVPKTEIELITEGLIEMPAGRTWTDDTHTALRDMTETEKIIAGLADIPVGMHIVSGELVPMTDDEQLAVGARLVFNLHLYGRLALYARAYFNLVAETRRVLVLDVDLHNGKVKTFLYEALVAKAHALYQVKARALKPRKVVGVINHAHCVRLGKPHFYIGCTAHHLLDLVLDYLLWCLPAPY